ncbi:hypothetical protein AMJ80_00905 [bacterium SM23_31]|nr:MAG: hypothetical protein AMJ80_00905 [bacterium SM23_31]
METFVKIINNLINEAAMQGKFFTFIPFILILFFFCSKQDGTYTIEIKDGVRHVLNNAPLWGDEPKVALEFVQKIGELDTEDENYMLYRANDVALDIDGNIYILDAGNYCVKKYDKQGKYLATIGRKGQGPGEFEFPVSIDLDTDGNIYLADISNNRILVLLSNGKEMRTFKIGKRVSAFKLLPSGDILTGNTGGASFLSISNRNQEFNQPVVKIYDTEGNLKSEFGKPFDFKDIAFNTVGNKIYFTFDWDNNMYICFAYQNRVEKYSLEGKLSFTADRLLNYDISRPKSSMEEVSGGGYMIRMPKINVVSDGIGIDYKGRIWVMTYLKQREKDNPEIFLKLEIYSNDGILLGEIPWSEDFTPAKNSIHMFGYRVFFFDFEGTSVYEYKIVEK